jgi:hypothetical protein
MKKISPVPKILRKYSIEKRNYIFITEEVRTLKKNKRSKEE